MNVRTILNREKSQWNCRIYTGLSLFCFSAANEKHEQYLYRYEINWNLSIYRNVNISETAITLVKVFLTIFVLNRRVE